MRLPTLSSSIALQSTSRLSFVCFLAFCSIAVEAAFAFAQTSAVNSFELLGMGWSNEAPAVCANRADVERFNSAWSPLQDQALKKVAQADLPPVKCPPCSLLLQTGRCISTGTGGYDPFTDEKTPPT